MIRFLIRVSAIAIGLGSASTAVVAQHECPNLSNYLLDELGNCIDLDNWKPASPTVTEGSLLDEISLDVGALYPGKDLPFQKVIALDNNNLSAIGVLTDWWQKRPTRIQVYEWQDGARGKLLGEARFPTYLENVCGPQFDRRCEWSEHDQSSAIAQLIVPLNEAVTSNAIAIEVDGLLSPANKYVLLMGIRLYSTPK